MRKVLRRYEMSESSEYGECVVELVAIGWELYALEINGYEEKRIVGLDNAINMLDDEINLDNPEWEQVDVSEQEAG